jgi:hypothetical protein
MKDDASPFLSWKRSDWIKYAQVAKADELGALFFYLRDTLNAFCARVRKMDSTIWIFIEDAARLPALLRGSQFDRIEVSISSAIKYSWTFNNA